MSHLKIIRVRGHGDHRTEYVTLRVLQDCNLSHFALVDSTFTKVHTISNRHRHMFRFPALDVKRGSYVHLHTRPGTPTTTRDRNGVLHHSCYWGLNTPMWNDDGDMATLLVVADMQLVASA